jgi:cytochrome c oxidase cbb3-type subunit 1
VNNPPQFESQEAEGLAVRRHALAWLVFANAVGVLLAVLLLHPGIGALPGGLGYGRWVPLHTDAQLYGWCALPLVGVLLAGYGRGSLGGAALPVLWAWSAALALGCLSWLTGGAGGKPFMEWAGWTRPLFPLAMLGLWLLLAHGEERQWSAGEGGAFRAPRWLRLALLVVLLPVPLGFYFSTSPSAGPAVNPDSGGATGASLFVSTLGILIVHGLAPLLLGLGRVPGTRLRVAGYWLLLALGLGAWLLADRGDASHHAAGQIFLLGLLFLLMPAAWLYFGSFTWPVEARRWLVAGLAWGGLLVVTGFLTFLPGISERWKFTHVLVAHSHLAMAGYVSSLGWALLLCLNGRAAPHGFTFLLWQGACILHVAPLVPVGFSELARPTDSFFCAPQVQAMLSFRLLSGLVMLLVSLLWLRDSLRASSSVVDRSPTSP